MNKRQTFIDMETKMKFIAPESEQKELQRKFLKALSTIEDDAITMSNRTLINKAYDITKEAIGEGLRLNRKVEFEGLDEFTPYTFAATTLQNLIHASTKISNRDFEERGSIDDENTSKAARRAMNLYTSEILAEVELNPNEKIYLSPSDIEALQLSIFADDNNLINTVKLVNHGIKVDFQYLVDSSFSTILKIIEESPEFADAFKRFKEEKPEEYIIYATSSKKFMSATGDTLSKLFKLYDGLPADIADTMMNKMISNYINLESDKIDAYIEAGANPLGKYAKDQNEKSYAWILCGNTSQQENAKFLIEKIGKSAVSEIHDGKSIIDHAIENKCTLAAKALSEFGAIPSAKNVDHLLLVAIQDEQLELVNILIPHVKNINKVSKFGINFETPLSIAARVDNPDIFKALIDAGSDINQRFERNVYDGPKLKSIDEMGMAKIICMYDSAKIYNSCKELFPDQFFKDDQPSEKSKCLSQINAQHAMALLGQLSGLSQSAKDFTNEMKNLGISVSGLEGVSVISNPKIR